MFRSLRQFPLYSKTEPPAVLKEHFNDDTFKKSQAYGKDKAKFSLYSGLFRQALDSALLHYGVYAWSWDIAGSIRSTIGYGPDHEVCPTARSSQMLLICPAFMSIHRSLSPFFSPLSCSLSPPSQASHSPLIKPSSSRKNMGLTKQPRGCS